MKKSLVFTAINGKEITVFIDHITHIHSDYNGGDKTVIYLSSKESFLVDLKETEVMELIKEEYLRN